MDLVAMRKRARVATVSKDKVVSELGRDLLDVIAELERIRIKLDICQGLQNRPQLC